MKRRHFFAFAVIAPLSLMFLSRTDFGRKYLHLNGWILKSDDI